MEQLFLKNLQTLILLAPNDLKTLTLARSLLTNPHSSPSTLPSVAETLIQALERHRQDRTFARHVIKIIGDAAALHRSLIPSAVQAVRPFLSADDRIAADALGVLDSLGEFTVLDEELVISLASSSTVSVRSRIIDVLVSNLALLRPEVMVRMFLGLSTDLYPLVRKSAGDGVVELLKRDGDWVDGPVVKCCYDRAVELLRDEDELVRSVAVRLVSECARLFAVIEAGGGSELINVIFVQLCWMARDMSLKVRTEAFIALGKVRLVSEGVLVQSLSKKIQGSKNGGGSLIVKESKFPLSSAAGAFVHGIEDEFHEVRMAACKSLGMLSKFSIRFAGDALNLLMEMLNDDVVAVRLQTLQTLFEMATHDHLTIQEKHMQMFLGLLSDISAEIRSVARKVLRLLKLPKSEMFISSVDGLIANLVMHPEEEEDIFCVLFFIGKNHGNFTAKRVKDYKVAIKGLAIFLARAFLFLLHRSQQLVSEHISSLQQYLKCSSKINTSHHMSMRSMIPHCGGAIVQFCERELSLDSPQTAALLVLAISLSFSDEQLICDVPSTIFAYAIPLLGRISRSLKDVIHHDLLLVHLGNRSGMPFLSKKLKSKNDELLPWKEEGISKKTRCKGPFCSFPSPIHNETSEISLKRNLFYPSVTSTSLEQSRQEGCCLDEKTIQPITLLFKTVTEIWLLIQLQCTRRAQRMLRACMEELGMIALNADGSDADLLAFALNYIQVIQIFAEIWEQLQPKHVIGMNVLDLLLEKLDICLKRLRYSFSGFSRDEECHILELILLGYVLRMYNVGICSSLVLNKVQTVFSCLACLSEEGQLKLSDFCKELKKSYIEQRTAEAPKPFHVHKLLQLFCLEQIPFSGGLKHIKAELLAVGNNCENPLPFISGLPVGITFQIALYNISNKDMLWLQMAVGKSVQYAFLDLCLFGGSDEARTCTINLPFYATPKAASFLLRACVCMECQIEGFIDCKKVKGGPKHDVTLLSEEIDVYLVQTENR